MQTYRFEKYTGQDSEVTIPSYMEEKPVVIIGAKAFLSCKTIERLVLPDTIQVIEDWGFAHMKNLCEVVLPARDILFGRQVFLGCDSLCRVSFLETFIPKDSQGREQEDSLYEGIPYFLASMFRHFPEEELEKLQTAGDAKGQWEWLAAYDKALLQYLRLPHDTGFEPAFIGWFDVEDVDDQKQNYLLQRRRDKLQLIFQRMRYPEYLAEADRQYLQDYLSGEAPLIQEMFLEENTVLGRDIRCYRIWQQAGGLTGEQARLLLTQIPEEEPEIRGYLLQIELEDVDKTDFFAELEL